MSKLTEAIFAFDDGNTVTFLNIDGAPAIVVANKDLNRKPLEIPNPRERFNGLRYKPCETHARRLVKFLELEDKANRRKVMDESRDEKRRRYSEREEFRTKGLRIVK